MELSPKVSARRRSAGVKWSVCTSSFLDTADTTYQKVDIGFAAIKRPSYMTYLPYKPTS